MFREGTKTQTVTLGQQHRGRPLRGLEIYLVVRVWHQAIVEILEMAYIGLRKW